VRRVPPRGCAEKINLHLCDFSPVQLRNQPTYLGPPRNRDISFKYICLFWLHMTINSPRRAPPSSAGQCPARQKPPAPVARHWSNVEAGEAFTMILHYDDTFVQSQVTVQLRRNATTGCSESVHPGWPWKAGQFSDSVKHAKASAKATKALQPAKKGTFSGTQLGPQLRPRKRRCVSHIPRSSHIAAAGGGGAGGSGCGGGCGCGGVGGGSGGGGSGGGGGGGRHGSRRCCTRLVRRMYAQESGAAPSRSRSARSVCEEEGDVWPAAHDIYIHTECVAARAGLVC
jgi:hypothetical protein